MLVMGRKEREEIVIGKPGDVLTEPIVVSLVRLSSDGVRLGVTAQKDVDIRRAELVEAATTNESEIQGD
mgnify:CR=1 FL=1